MSKRVFIWVAHPRANSLGSALADAYEAGVRAEGGEVRRMELSEMQFDMEVTDFTVRDAPLEPDLKRWQENLVWADHLFIVHPYWWAAMPTKAKSVLDRALAPGVAFKYHARGVAWDKLLAGRTADAVITSDTPPWIDTLLYQSPGRRVMRNQVLAFCGIKARKVLQLGSVKLADEKKIRGWFERMERLGRSAARPRRRFLPRLRAAPAKVQPLSMA